MEAEAKAAAAAKAKAQAEDGKPRAEETGQAYRPAHEEPDPKRRRSSPIPKAHENQRLIGLQCAGGGHAEAIRVFEDGAPLPAMLGRRGAEKAAGSDPDRKIAHWRAPSPRCRAIGAVDLPRTLDRLWGNFPS